MWRTVKYVSSVCIKSLKSGKRYIGSTGKSAVERLAEHNAGSNKYTKGNRPYVLLYSEDYEDKEFAEKREKFLKSGTGRRVLDRLQKKLYVPVAQMDRARPS